MSIQNPDVPTYRWWQSRRLEYNIKLLAAVFVAGITTLVITTVMSDRFPCMEITGFTLAFQMIGALIGFAMANVCYFLGPIIETFFKPTHVSKYRSLAYTAGCWFSFAIPMVIPALALTQVVLGSPGDATQC